MTTPKLRLVGATAPAMPDAPRDGGIRVDSTARSRRTMLAFDLPPGNGVRWVARRKIEVVAAVMAGAITLDDVCQRYALSLEEFESWRQIHGADANQLVSRRMKRGRRN